MKVAVSLAGNILAPLGITAASSAIDTGVQKKMHGCGTTKINENYSSFLLKILIFY